MKNKDKAAKERKTMLYKIPVKITINFFAITYHATLYGIRIKSLFYIQATSSSVVLILDIPPRVIKEIVDPSIKQICHIFMIFLHGMQKEMFSRMFMLCFSMKWKHRVTKSYSTNL